MLIWGKRFQTSYKNLDNSSWNRAVNCSSQGSIPFIGLFCVWFPFEFCFFFLKKSNISEPSRDLSHQNKIDTTLPSGDKHLTELTSGLIALTSSRQAVETYERSYYFCQIWNSSSHLLSVCSSISKVAIKCLLHVGGGSVIWLFLHWNTFSYDLFWVLLIFWEWAMCTCRLGNNLLTDWLSE